MLFSSFLKKWMLLFFTLIISVGLFFGSPESTFAQDELLEMQSRNEIVRDGVDTFTDTSLFTIIGNVIDIFLGILGIILLGLILWGGFLITTAGGNDEKVIAGKKIFQNALIGLVIILSAWSIARFIVSRFARATGAITNNIEQNIRPEFDNFFASGALGRVIGDHYPFRDQDDVARNTGIVITFTDAIDPSSIIQNSNESCWMENGGSAVGEVCERDENGTIVDPYYGDCVSVGDELRCDELRSEVIQIFASPIGNNEAGPLLEARALTSYEGAEKNAYTFVLRPIDLLGTFEESVWYTVDVRPEVRDINGESVFAQSRIDSYRWNFQTGIDLDVDPPHVIDVYPREGAQAVPKNTIIQVTFDEPMDPTMLQGFSNPESDFINVIFHEFIDGEWLLSNGYRTLEFLPANTCGQNSCGDAMHCLPLFDCDDPEDLACEDPYEILIRTAQLTGAENLPFQAIPFTGVMDIAGNALDGRTAGQADMFAVNNVADGKPLVGFRRAADGEVLLKAIGEQEREADNFWWTFAIKNIIDKTPPYIESFLPDVDQIDVPEAFVPVMNFSERLWLRSLQGTVQLEEYPANVNDLDDLFFVVRAEIDRALEKTRLQIDHRAFGPNDLDLYYFPSVSSSIKDVQQNCFYPGLGPVAPEQQCTINNQGVAVGCVPVSSLDAAQDTGCVIANPNNNDMLSQEDIETCLEVLQAPELSPVTNR